MIYHVFANKSNIGDWLSAKGIQTCLTGQSVTELFCDTDFVDETMQRLTALKPDDFVIIGGGGLFMNYFLPFWEAFSTVSQRVAFGIWGVGYCDTTHEDSLPPHGLLEAVIRQSRFCFVRDAITRAYLSNVDLPAPSNCTSLLCLWPSQRGKSDLLHVDNYTTVGSEAFDFMDELAQQYADETDRVYRRTNNRISSADDVQLRQRLELYETSELVISSALHGCIIGTALGKKVLAVSGDRKIDSFMHSIGLGDWVCSRDQLHRLPHMLQMLVNQESCDVSLAGYRQTLQEIGRKVRMHALAPNSIQP